MLPFAPYLVSILGDHVLVNEERGSSFVIDFYLERGSRKESAGTEGFWAVPVPEATCRDVPVESWGLSDSGSDCSCGTIDVAVSRKSRSHFCKH